MTIEEVEEFKINTTLFGYKAFKGSRLMHENAMSTAYQKRVRDITGRTKYFITLYCYDYTIYPNFLGAYGITATFSFDTRTVEPEITKPTFWGELSFTSFEEVEPMVENLWVAYGSHYYDYEDE